MVVFVFQLLEGNNSEASPQATTKEKQLDLVSGPESSVQVMEGQSYIQDDEDMDEYIEDDFDAQSPQVDLEGKSLAKGNANAPIHGRPGQLPETSLNKFSNKSDSVKDHSIIQESISNKSGSVKEGMPKGK